jgi:putative PIG3 family NAD(P)H quinone oxidoreductase
VNRADLLQRQGHYPPPPGASEIIGLECAGRIAALGEGVTGWSVGDEVCALLAGGGYAEKVAVPAVQVLPVPDGVDLVTAGGLPEVACTVWSNVVAAGRLAAGETFLIQGGSSGIGTHAIQVAKALGARVVATASPQRAERCRELGADIVIDYHDDVPAELKKATDGHGADVILDNIGAKGLAANVASLAADGRLLVIGMQGGTKAELDLGKLMAKRASVHATTLRGRPATGHGGKAEIVAAVRHDVWPDVERGVVRPIVDRRLPMSRAAEAHRLVEASEHIGKVLLLPED